MFKRVRDLREEKKLSQSYIAKILHIDQSTYSDYETGQINIPVDALIKISDIHETSIDYIVGKTDVREPYPKASK